MPKLGPQSIQFQGKHNNYYYHNVNRAYLSVPAAYRTVQDYPEAAPLLGSTFQRKMLYGVNCHVIPYLLSESELHVYPS